MGVSAFQETPIFLAHRSSQHQLHYSALRFMKGKSEWPGSCSQDIIYPALAGELMAHVAHVAHVAFTGLRIKIKDIGDHSLPNFDLYIYIYVYCDILCCFFHIYEIV